MGLGAKLFQTLYVSPFILRPIALLNLACKGRGYES
jgi:hypothetical protein